MFSCLRASGHPRSCFPGDCPFARGNQSFSIFDRGVASGAFSGLKRSRTKDDDEDDRLDGGNKYRNGLFPRKALAQGKGWDAVPPKGLQPLARFQPWELSTLTLRPGR
jgi:hypothetical protein